MEDSILMQGKFTQTAAEKAINLVLRSDVDWIKVYNHTKIAAAGGDTAAYYYWQRGMSVDTGYKWTMTALATNALVISNMTSGGFTLIDTTVLTPGRLNGSAGTANITGISDDPTPVVANDGDNHLQNGDIVRIFNTQTGTQLSAIDIEVSGVAAGAFTLTYCKGDIFGGGVGGTASWRQIPYDSVYYPKLRYITDISAPAATTTITTSVTHGYKVGQQVKFDMGYYKNSNLAASSKCNELNGLVGTIISVNTGANTFTVDIDSTLFSLFVFPIHTLTVDGYTPATVIPVGMDTTEALNLGVDAFTDKTFNDSYIGIKLGGGANHPGGASGDVVYWVAGKASFVDNDGTLVR